LTTGNDLYLWGGRPGQVKICDELEDYPTPVDVEGNDWMDVAVGQEHIIALSTNGDVWVIGEGGNGQLGLGDDTSTLRHWRKVDLNLGGMKVSKVYAGYKNSFLLVE
jgi:alpha-tubulin suppressor-like RCC1 family protein